MQARDNFLRPIYEEAGFFDGTGIEEHLRELIDKGVEYTFDGALINSHTEFLTEVNPALEKLPEGFVTDAEPWVPKTRTQLAQKLRDVQDSLRPPERAFPKLLQIAEAFLRDAVEINPTGHSAEVWRAVESLLWRAYEALKATHALTRVGVLEFKVTLGVAQEALIGLEFLMTEPDKVKAFEANAAFGMWQMARRFADSLIDGGYPAEDLEDLVREQGNELHKLGYDLGDNPAVRELRRNARELKWHKMVRPKDDALIPLEALRMRYQVVFSERDAVAHSAATIWPAYTKLSDGKVTAVASIHDTAPSLGPLSLWVWSDFFAALKKLRPALQTDYARWCVTLYLGGGYSVEDTG